MAETEEQRNASHNKAKETRRVRNPFSRIDREAKGKPGLEQFKRGETKLNERIKYRTERLQKEKDYANCFKLDTAEECQPRRKEVDLTSQI